VKTGTETKTVTVKILEKEVQIACAPGDEDDLMRAARHVDQSMRQFRERSNTSTAEKIAIITAISTANELLKVQSGSNANAVAKGSTASSKSVDEEDESIQQRIRDMQKRLDSVLQD